VTTFADLALAAVFAGSFVAALALGLGLLAAEICAANGDAFAVATRAMWRRSYSLAGLHITLFLNERGRTSRFSGCFSVFLYRRKSLA
jgi:hypothetical protein